MLYMRRGRDRYFTTTGHIAPDVGMKSMNRIRLFCFFVSNAACFMVNQLSSNRKYVRPEAHSSKVGIIDAVCINCNKRFKSIRAVSMHLRITGTRHAVKSSITVITMRKRV